MSLFITSLPVVRPVCWHRSLGRRCVQVCARSDIRHSGQISSTLQAAIYLWTPAALAFTQGDVPISRKTISSSVSSGADSAGEAAQQAGEAAQQATEAVANELPDWLSDNPLLLAGIVVAVATVTFVVANLIAGGGSKVKAISAGAALAVLEEKPNAFLLDIRRRKEVSTDGSPDIRSTKRKLETLAFSQVDPSGELTPDPKFADGFAQLRSVQPGAVAILLDTFGTEAPGAAKALDSSELESVLTITGGVDGLNGWRASELPWREPVRLPQIGGLSGRLESLAEDFKSKPTLTKAGLAAGAAGAAGFLIFQEAGTVLEVLGVLAGVRFLGNRFLFAKDRKQTLELLQGVREGNVEMPKEVKKDLKEFQTALRLPGTEEQQKTQSAAGPKSSAANPPKDFKVTSTPAAQAQKAGSKSGAASPPQKTKAATATQAAQAQQAGSKSSPTAAASRPSSSQPSPTKPSQAQGVSADKRTKPEASAKEARQWIDSWRGKSENGSPSSKQVDKAKEAVSKEKSKESANI
ncbi:hypothetical protein WJX74_000542 [Apatococcus lobatus]|uniref:Uncharacterized protein n=1 Tax=Apatococcus lobatus TaxID=904363 RepID=A0AAW1QN16_9CHLO